MASALRLCNEVSADSTLGGYAHSNYSTTLLSAPFSPRPAVKIGSISVTLQVSSLRLLPQSDMYEIELSDAVVVSTSKATLKFQVSTSRMKKINRELADDDIDDLLDEIEHQNEFMYHRDATIHALRPRTINKEWGKICVKQAPQFTAVPMASGSSSALNGDGVVTSPSYSQFGASLSAVSGQTGHAAITGVNALNIIKQGPSAHDALGHTIFDFNGHALTPQNNDAETAQTRGDAMLFEESCAFYLGECVAIERLIFVLKYYRLWREYKQSVFDSSVDSHRNFRSPSFSAAGLKMADGMEKKFASMSDFLASLEHYSSVDLLNDYLHVRKCHFSNDLIGFFRDKLHECHDAAAVAPLSTDAPAPLPPPPTATQTATTAAEAYCVCMARNRSTREVYSLSAPQRRALYWLDATALDEGSVHEIREINLQHQLDVMHCSFVHNAMSSGAKFVSDVDLPGSTKTRVVGGKLGLSGAAAADSSTGGDSAATSAAPGVYDEFGVYFDYWKENRKDFCAAKFENLKHELLNNDLHRLCWNDFQSVYERGLRLMETQFARFCLVARREFDAMKSAVRFGEAISLDHVIAILTYTNFSALQARFKLGCKKLHSKERKEEVMRRNAQIAHWCRLLKECIYYFGDLLGDSERLYHGVNRKLRFQRVAKKFNLPMSTSANYLVAAKLAQHVHGTATASGGGICLQLGKMFALEENNLFLDVAVFSDYPNEAERVIFGGRLGFVDIIYDSVSHSDEVMSLRLYQKMIDGDWFSSNELLFQKKYQYGILRLMQSMMQRHKMGGGVAASVLATGSVAASALDAQPTVHKSKLKARELAMDAYIEQLFVCIVQNVGFGTKTIWINQDECSKLVPELNKLLFNKFLPFLRKHFKIRMKYCNLMSMKIKRDALLSSSRQYQLYSPEYRFQISAQQDIQLHFRCYKQFDSVRNEDVLMAKFEVKLLPNSVSSVKVYGGLWFPQIAFDRWDYCTLTHSKLSQGCPLFPLSRIQEIDTLKIEICFQLYRVYDQFGKRLKL